MSHLNQLRKTEASLNAPQRGKTTTRLFLIIAVILVISSLFAGFLIDFENAIVTIREELDQFRETYASHPIQTAVGYFVVYVALALLCVPGLFLLSMLGGALFGNVIGVLLISFSSSLGSTIAFLVIRQFFRTQVVHTFGEKLHSINQSLHRNGFLYLLSLRLVPMVPYYLINMAAAVTKVRSSHFYFATLMGMVPIHFVFTNAGTQISQIQTTQDIFSTSILFSLSAMAVVPLVLRLTLQRLIRIFQK